MDPSYHHDSYLNWSSGRVQVIVATKTFALSINTILDMNYKTVSLRAFCLGHKNSAELGGMVVRQQQQFCIGSQIFLMQMHEF
jgi:hypothetical protein